MKYYIEDLITDSPPEIMKDLEGIYYCYYLSSFGYRIKKEPLLISYDAINHSYMVRKGNDQSFARYYGLGYVSNHHTFSIQIKEVDTLISDHFIAHFHLPPFYANNLNMLKGISISMSNSYLPISRKVILHRCSNTVQLERYNDMETFFYEEGASEDMIVNYLQASKSFMEYIPIPHPEYDIEDLNKEKQVSGIIEY